MDYKELEQAMADLDEDTVLDMMKEVMDNNGEGVKEALEACQKGMATVGDLFEKGEYFVAQNANKIICISWKNNQKFGIGQFQKEKCFKKSRYTYDGYLW